MDVGEYKKMYKLEDKHFWFLGKRIFVDQFLKKHINSSSLKILDVGSGTGGMTGWLSKYGDVVGLERSKEAIKCAKKRRLKIVRGDANKLPFKNEKFDLVTIFDVLYHKNINDDVKVLTEIFRVLKPDGLLMVTDSAISWLYGEHDIVMQARERYSLNQLSKKVESMGFKILKKSYIFFFLFPIVLIKRLFKFKNKGSDVMGVGDLVNRILICVLKIEASGLRFFSYPIGSSVAILAKKMEKQE